MNNIYLIKDQTANPGPLGLFGFAMTTVLLNIHNAGFFPVNSMIMGMGVFFGGGAQFVAGVMEWKKGNNFGSIAFMSYGAFWLTLVFTWLAPMFGVEKPDGNAMGCYLGMWGLFTLINFLQTLKGNLVGKLLFGSLTLLLFLLAAGNFTGSQSILHFAGWTGIICGFIAFYEASAIMINQKYEKAILPL
ncbi:acetate uptake transporter [Empedobacter falsenii]|uniref:acetate uptake transporter n=1 Tax=Empedobacter falsenii TaxID=343874 RepID=UPI002576BE41|nr:acetate uptake transporter [Empedobacter falsenii]MDM1547490.1 acetate uptake transporter [Empedobacter falsenii]